jgi:nucleoid-associated protein YgaU
MKQIREVQPQWIVPGLGGAPPLARPAAPNSTAKIEPAADNAHVAPVVTPPAGSIPAPPGNDAPLGDVARYYQWLKETREAQNKAAAVAASHAVLAPSPLPEPSPASVASPGIHQPSFGVSPSPRGGELELPRRVRVARGDSLWKLAKHYLGSGAKWRKLAARNPQIVDPRRLQVGDWIRLSDLSSLPRGARTVRVRKGDTLWKIAATELGSGLGWTCIARANGDLADANLILPERVLIVPSACRVASRP